MPINIYVVRDSRTHRESITSEKGTSWKTIKDNET